MENIIRHKLSNKNGNKKFEINFQKNIFIIQSRLDQSRLDCVRGVLVTAHTKQKLNKCVQQQ